MADTHGRVSLPAFCDTCGAVFRSGIVVDDFTDARFAGNSAGPCPVCAGTGHVAGRVFDFIGSAIPILSAPQVTEDRLTRLATILTEACGRRRSLDEIGASIDDQVPELAGIADLVRKDSAELYSLLTLIVAAIALLIKARRDRGPKAQITVDQTMDHILNETKVVARSLGPRLRPRVRRNGPCRCGSGKRYKHCCGRLSNGGS